MIDWFFHHRPQWLKKIAMFWFLHEDIWMPDFLVPHILGLWLGRRGHKVEH